MIYLFTSLWKNPVKRKGENRGNMYSELFLEDTGLKGEDQPIKNTDYKIIM